MFKYLLPKSETRLLRTAFSSRLTGSSQTFANVPPIKIKIQPVPPVKLSSYMALNKALKRPLSPHLTIYKTQMSSMMSISVRLTGICLGVMAWTVCLTKPLTGLSVEDAIDACKSLALDDCYWTAAKTAIVFPFSFHFVAGIRHLMFDTAKFLEKTQFYATGCVAIVLAFTLTLILGSMEDIREKYDKIQHQKHSKTE